MRMSFHNVDAESRLVRPGSDDGKYVFFSSLFQSKTTMNGEVVIAGTPYAFDGPSEGEPDGSHSVGNFTLPPGERATYTMSFWLDGSINLSDVFVSPSSYGLGHMVFDLGLVSSAAAEG